MLDPKTSKWIMHVFVLLSHCMNPYIEVKYMVVNPQLALLIYGNYLHIHLKELSATKAN